MAAMRYARFTRADFPIYRAWYTDEALNRQLGPLDETWLEYVLTDESGNQLSFFLDNELVAVAGVALPVTPGLPHVITDLAVQPTRRGQGIGGAVLARLLAAEEFAAAMVWEAYIAPDNPRAQRFVERHGWVRSAPRTDGDPMLIYRYVVNAAVPSELPE
jgi:GNAT superfamily N-acetyltransferase